MAHNIDRNAADQINSLCGDAHRLLGRAAQQLFSAGASAKSPEMQQLQGLILALEGFDARKAKYTK